jgi:Fe-S oxidoreductase
MPGADNARAVVFFADTFNRYFEPENIEAALGVLTAAGYGVHLPKPADGSSRPLCCGRTFLAVGLVEEARVEAERCVAALAPLLARGMPVVGLEPSCILGFRDELPALIKSDDARALASNALLFEEFLAREAAAGTLDLALKPVAKRALLHGHCHQKSFGAMGATEAVLRLIPELAVETVESSCCGMAGAFGYGADTIDVSLKMAELSLLPAVRKAEPDTLVLADGTSCRHQIKDGSGRDALHVARALAMSLNPSAAGAGSART